MAKDPAVLKKTRGRPKIDTSVRLELYKGSKQERLQQLFMDWSSCTACELGKYRDLENSSMLSESLSVGEDAPAPYNIVFGDGNPDAHIMIIGEAPGVEEMDHQIPFIGNAGHLLNKLIGLTTDDPNIKQIFYDFNSLRKPSQEHVKEFTQQMVEYRQKDFFITNAVMCRPPENRTPLATEVKECWDRLWNTIYTVDPILIIACGNTALSAVARKVQAKITKERGTIYDAEYEGHVGKVTYPVLPMYHPSFLLRTADFKQKGGDWDKTVDDFKKGLWLVDQLRFQYYGTPIPDRTPYGL